MVKVVRVPAPTPATPPPTFTIEGLTKEDAEKIMALIGVTEGEIGKLNKVYYGISEALGLNGYNLSPFRVLSSRGEHIASVRLTKRNGDE